MGDGVFVCGTLDMERVWCYTAGLGLFRTYLHAFHSVLVSRRLPLLHTQTLLCAGRPRDGSENRARGELYTHPKPLSLGIKPSLVFTNVPYLLGRNWGTVGIVGPDLNHIWKTVLLPHNGIDWRRSKSSQSTYTSCQWLNMEIILWDPEQICSHYMKDTKILTHCLMGTNKI